jgi:hypothetical protein
MGRAEEAWRTALQKAEEAVFSARFWDKFKSEENEDLKRSLDFS